MKPFRLSIPNRTCTSTYSNYSSYKPYLRSDFRKRCGYCDDIDSLCGGARGFHIDHFRPQVPFSHLKNEYRNLVYACPYCNGAKSNDWPSGIEDVAVLDDGSGYLDPCDVDFDSHFERNDYGRIHPKTAVGKYMYKKLKLGLRRHQLAWAYEQLGNSLKELNSEIENLQPEGDDYIEALKHHQRLTSEYLKYKHLFEETI
jgi:hypothetical protein